MKKNNKGFSLVELIVVIAIMAILAAVAVAGFSFYIPKAQQANDKQMVSDIEYAMTLAGYSGDFVIGDSGYIILSAEGEPVIANGDKIEKVMIATFGTNWKKEAVLQYDGWTVNTALLESATNNGQAISGSIFVQNSSANELLENVQTVTQAASGMLGTVVKSEDQYLTALETALGSSYMELAAEAGLIVSDENGNYSMPSGSVGADGMVNVSPDMQNQLSNLMVLSVADELDGLSSQDMAAIMNGTYTGNASMAAQMAVQYSVVKAVDLKNGGNTQAFSDLNDSLKNASGISDIQTAINNYSAAGGEQFDTYLYDASGNITTEAQENFNAVSAIMGGVTSVADDYKNADSLKDANLFTSGGVSNYLNLYVSAAALQLPADLPENGIVLIYQMGDDGVMHVYSLYS